MFRLPFLSRKPDAIAPLFADIVTASRLPAAYRDWQVPDDFEGRFERLALMMVLVLRRMKTLPAPAEALSQELVDRLFSHLDDGVRRVGIGDLSVGKKVKGLAQGFYGRAKVYTEALESAEDSALRTALARNLYASAIEPDAVPVGLLAEIAAVDAAVTEASLEQLLAGAVLQTVHRQPPFGG